MGAGGCCLGEQGRAWVGGELHGLGVEVMEADDQMMDALRAGPVEAHVAGGPSVRNSFASLPRAGGIAGGYETADGCTGLR